MNARLRHVCQTCRQTYAVTEEDLDPSLVVGGEAVSHGICDDCAEFDDIRDRARHAAGRLGEIAGSIVRCPQAGDSVALERARGLLLDLAARVR